MSVPCSIIRLDPVIGECLVSPLIEGVCSPVWAVAVFCLFVWWQWLVLASVTMFCSTLTRSLGILTWRSPNRPLRGTTTLETSFRVWCCYSGKTNKLHNYSHWLNLTLFSSDTRHEYLLVHSFKRSKLLTRWCLFF